MTKRLGGRYELQERIGDGGMAIVYRALDTLLGRPVAVKMLRSQYAGDDEFVNRFRQEAQSAAKLSHPNIVNLYDVGISGNEYYIVMEYVDGPTLKEVIRNRGPLPMAEAIQITEQICDALECAHDHHIIHRDVKPHNILMTKTGRVKVTDFGIARAMSTNTMTHHDAKSVLGSVHYFSPEQARGGSTDVKSDIYSLGVVMYEMVTGMLPFSGDTAVSVALKHLRDKFPEPREVNPAIPQSMENIILKCLVKDPSLRYESIKSVRADLQDAMINPDVPKFVMPMEATDATIVVPAVGGMMEEDGEPEHTKPTGKRKWIRILVWWMVALLILVIGMTTAYFIVMKAIQVPTVNLPNVVGMTEKDAVAKLVAAGISQTQIAEQSGSNTRPKNVVYEQDPAGPMEIKQGRPVTLYVSSGPPQIIMPSLLGEPYDIAVQTLVNLNIPAANIKKEMVQNSQDAGTVVSSNPPADTPIPANSQIVLQVSEGNQTNIPSILGKTLDQAQQILAAAHLQLGQVTYMPSSAPDGQVFQIVNYEIGQQVSDGTAIDVYVSQSSGENGGPIGSAGGNGTGNSTDSSGAGTSSGFGTGGNDTTSGNSGQGLGTTNSTQ